MYKFQTFTPYQYLLIDLANNYGLDKESYDVRINWAREFLLNPDLKGVVPDEPFLFQKSLKNLKEVLAGEPSGALVRFDAVCSGIQLLSVLTGCRKGCEATGAINTGKRPNAYLAVKYEMERILGQSIQVSYKDIKDAVMTSCYGSKKVPKKLFSGKVLDAFNVACKKVAPAAFNLLDIMRDTWDKKALSHSWTLPDGFNVFLPVLDTRVVRLEIEELGGYRMSTLITENTPLDFSVSNIANITHSIDGYLVRNLVRYCNYDENQVKKVKDIIERELNSRTDEKGVDISILEKVEKLNLLDISIINDMNAINISIYPKEILELVYKDIQMMLTHKPFEIVPVHDCFGIHPNNVNQLRFWYNEMLVKLSNSNLLVDILTQLYKKEVRLKMFEKDLTDELRQSSYAIC